MSKGKLPKVLVIGHTKGIGKAIFDYYSNKGLKVKGLSRSNGYHLNDLDSFLKHIVKYHSNKPKKIIVITSTSGTNICFDKTLDINSYKEYSRHKKKLIKYIERIQQEILNQPLQIFDVCPDVVDTKMSKGLWTDVKKLDPKEVSKAVQYCLESKFNINKIVIQKKC